MSLDAVNVDLRTASCRTALNDVCLQRIWGDFRLVLIVNVYY